MRKILGILGGLGPQASASFYQLLIDKTKASKDQEHIDIILFSHASMPDRTESINSGSREIEKILLDDLKKLEAFGADFITITCNTSHYFVDELKKQIKTPIISIVEETVEYLKVKGINKVGLLATDGTVKSRIYTDKLEVAEIDVVIPDEEHQKLVMDVIYKYVKAGERVPKDIFNKIEMFMKEKEVEGVILGCTELSVYGSEEHLSDFYVNPQEILSDKCIVLCGGELK